MGVRRVIDSDFWTDSKVGGFSPEDKYFMLFLLSNPFTKQLGIYEINIPMAAFQMGYSEDAFRALLDRFEKKYNIIIFSKGTSEVAILNFLKHSILKGGKPVEDCIKKEMELVKDRTLIRRVFDHIKDYKRLNVTVKKIIKEYYENENVNDIYNDNDNDNDNDNERFVVRFVNEGEEAKAPSPPPDPPANTETKRFTPPTVDEVKAYCIERGNGVNAERFIDYYTSNGWRVGKTPMKDWRAAVRTWERNGFSNGSAVTPVSMGASDLDKYF